MKLNIPTIRYWMARRGMNDADLARASGWSTATVSRVMNGKQKGIKPVKLSQLARALGRPEGELVVLEDMPQTPFQRAVVAALPEADEHVKAAIHSLLRLPEDLPPQ